MGFFDGAAGGIAGAVGSIAGGALGLVGNSQANAANMALAGLNYQQQKEFAQNGIRWKVADAKAAGIHPLAALGAMPTSYTPASTVVNPPDYSFLSEAGQNIGRAMDAKRTQEERIAQQAKQDILAAQQLESNRLDNEYKQTLIDQTKQDMVLQLARSAEMAARTQQQVPAMPSAGKRGVSDVFPTGDVKPDTSTVPTSARGRPDIQAGTPPDVRFYVGTGGTRVPLPTENSADAMDAAYLSGVEWAIRNKLLPWVSNFLPIEDKNRREGEFYDPLRGGYRKGRRFRDYFGY